MNGVVEISNICEHIGMSSFNIEQFGVPKATTHNPLDELKELSNFLGETVLIEC